MNISVDGEDILALPTIVVGCLICLLQIGSMVFFRHPVFDPGLLIAISFGFSLLAALYGIFENNLGAVTFLALCSVIATIQLLALGTVYFSVS